MAANDWLAERRTEVAADRILDAAEELFTRHDPGSVGMNEIAKAAGCSRATLYRYFENREALRTAYVARETHRLSESIDVDDIEDPRERLVAGIVTTLRLVRESPSLSA
ncbi:TetR/AcrR family transcriptional regulator, partial [Mycobacterium sp.]|uniref:TetR/AcrR family transcriptional regulator n=1 Tax=Mycobacterium sp. TaxID=1785 RepID=UPI003BB1F3CE